MIDLLYLLLYILACTGLGAGVLYLLLDCHQETCTSPLLYTTGFIVGCCINYYVWLLLGLAGLLHGVYVLPVLGAGILSGWVVSSRCRNWILQDFQSAVHTFRQLPTIWTIIAIGLVGWVFILAYAALTTGPSGDAEACYMYLPKVFSLKGAIGLPPYYDSFVKYGFWVETHYTILYLLGGTLAVKGFIVVMGLTAAFFAGKIARLCGAKTRGVIIVWFIIYTSSVFTGNFISGKTDAITCTLGLAAFFWLFETFDRQTIRRSILLGVLLAATILSKISYIPILGLGTAIFVIWSYIENNDHNQTISFYILIFLIILLTMSLCFAPHLAKNAFLFNNALAPFNEQSMAQVWYNAINTAHILKSYPLAVCFGMYPMQAGTVSPLLLVCAPFLFYLKKDHVNGYIFNKVLVISILSILTWKILSPSMVAPRYIMASFFLLSACGVVAVEKYIVLQKRNRFLKVLVLLSLILSLVIVTPPTIKSSQLTCYHQKQVEFINEKAEKSATILLYGYYGFYLRDDLITNTYSGFILRNNKKSRFNQIIEIHPAYILVQSDGIDSFNKDFTMPENDYFKLVLADEGLNFKSYMVEWKK